MGVSYVDFDSSGSVTDLEQRYWYQKLTDEERERDILFLLGLPGSGKSTTLQVLRDRILLSEIFGIPVERCPRIRLVKTVYARNRRKNAKGEWIERRADGHFLGPEQFGRFLNRSTDQDGPLVLIHHSLEPEIMTAGEAQRRYWSSTRKEQQHYRAIYLKDLIFALLANNPKRPYSRREIPCVAGPLNMYRAIGWMFPRKKAAYLEVEYGQLVRQLSIREHGPVDDSTYTRLGEQSRADRRFFRENDALAREVTRIQNPFVSVDKTDPSQPAINRSVLAAIVNLYQSNLGETPA